MLRSKWVHTELSLRLKFQSTFSHRVIQDLIRDLGNGYTLRRSRIKSWMTLWVEDLVHGINTKFPGKLRDINLICIFSQATIWYAPQANGHRITSSKFPNFEGKSPILKKPFSKFTFLFLSVLYSFGLMLTSWFQAPAQPYRVLPKTPPQRCAAMEKTASVANNEASEISIEQLSTVDFSQQQVQTRFSGLITIPVVVHVLYRTPIQNISTQQILSQMEVLNHDFRRLNSDTSETPSVFQSIAADCEIEFCLATKDPNGNPSVGITRTPTSVVNIGDTWQFYQSDSGGHDIWDRGRYMNVWVCENGDLAGYTFMPGGPAEYDGIVVDYRFFGTIGTATYPINRGRTLTHEIGHWLGLHHIWGDDLGACSGSDQVNDTPNQADAYEGCPIHPQVSCGSQDMFVNFMDYVFDACMNMFSQGQATRMNNTLFNIRDSLLNSDGCQLMISGLEADFSANHTFIREGQSVNFIDRSFGNITARNWLFTGGQPSQSNALNPQNVVYPIAGKYAVQLTVSDGIGDSITLKNEYITVLKSAGCDTSEYPLNGNLTLHPSGAGGFLSGNNGWGDLAKANYFSGYSGQLEITGALLHFGYVRIANPSAMITISAWDIEGLAGSPGNQVVSGQVSLAEIGNHVNSGLPTQVFFNLPFQPNGPFYLGVEFPQTGGDTVALFTNSDGDSKTGIGWEQWEDGGWYPYSYSIGKNLAHAIFPVSCQSVAKVPKVEQNPFLIYPNPSNGKMNLVLESGAINEKEITITVTDISGANLPVKSNLIHNKNCVEIDLSEQKSGIYIVEWKWGAERQIRKLMVVSGANNGY